MEKYLYVKQRHRFGRQCLFTEKNELLVSIFPKKSLSSNFILKNPINNGTQLSKQMAANEIITINPTNEHCGVNHREGGWPKIINIDDNEQKMLYKKKIERDDQYGIQIDRLAKRMETIIHQNNAVNIYEQYFDDLETIPLNDDLSARTIEYFRLPAEKNKSFANSISFSPDTASNEMSVAYCNFDLPPADNPCSYIWNIENPQNPIIKLDCNVSATKIEYNIRDDRYLAGGFLDGNVCIWDSRIGKNPTMITQKEYSHRDCVTSLLWIHSKSNSEFYSGSADGQIFWWDIRKFTEPSDSLLCDPVRTDIQNYERSHGCSVLEFEYSIPTKYMIGTTEGQVLMGNRKGLTPLEKISYKMNCHNGPIRSLERNPVFVKNFLTISDLSLKIWNEDCRENAIMSTINQDDLLTCGTWSRTRSSLIFVGHSNGTLNCWDWLIDDRKPIVSLKISSNSICNIKAHENGRLAAASDTNGDVYLIKFGKTLATSQRQDRIALSNVFDREYKREKILEAKIRNMKLKEKQDEQKKQQEDGTEKKEVNHIDHKQNERQIETEFNVDVVKEHRIRNAKSLKQIKQQQIQE